LVDITALFNLKKIE